MRSSSSSSSSSSGISSKDVWSSLRSVIDPELGINIVDLGMVRRVHVEREHVRVEVALTSMTCPFWDLFDVQVREALQGILNENDVTVTVAPSEEIWRPSFLSETAKGELEIMGLLPRDWR